jgi:hypothetical protein
VGTELKFYVEKGGQYYDITPIRATTAAGDITFAAVDGSNILTVSDTAHGAALGDFVIFADASTLGGNVTAEILNQEYQITTVIDLNSYEVTLPVTAGAADTGDGGALVMGEYQIVAGYAETAPVEGWGAGLWGAGPWGTGTPGGVVGDTGLRIWSQGNFGEDLIFTLTNGDIFYWDSSGGVTDNRGVFLKDMPSASEVPAIALYTLVSDVSRFVFALGCNELYSTDLDPMLIRWSDQENAVEWLPAATNQAGGIRLSSGSTIKAVKQARQEILVWSDTTLYSLQYVGAPIVWSTQIMGDNITILSDRAVTYSSGVAYWMGSGTFYVYDGRVAPLQCDLRKYIFGDFNYDQIEQVFSGSNEQFNEIWWFYCSATSTTVDRYVVYNYAQSVWYYGTMARTAWIDAGWDDKPLAAGYNHNLVIHETGIDDVETGIANPIEAFVQSSQFDLDDGHHFTFVWRIVPDITFEGSTIADPSVTMTLTPLHGSGSGYTDPASVGGVNTAAVPRSVTIPVEVYTEQLNIRVRGRQMALRVESDGAGVQWQLGSPRIDMRPDGRR